MDELNLFIPIVKIDEEKRMVFGRIAEETPDSAGEIFDYETSKPYFEEWSGFFQKATEGKSYGNVRVQHDSTRNAGHLTDISMLDEDKAIEACAKVNDEDEWTRLVDGDYTGFSIGGKYVKKWSDGKNKRYTAQPNEVSLVDYPMHKNCTFQLIKADGSTEDHEFKKVAERKDVNPDEGKKKYGDVKFADEKNKKYPIDTEAHIRAAWNYINKPKNAGKYSAGDLKSIKSKIIAAWKSKIDKDGPPSAKKGESEGDMTKTEALEELKKYAGQEVYDAGTAISCLSTLVYLYTMEATEDNADQTTALAAVIENLKNFIASEVQESDPDDVINRIEEWEDDKLQRLCDILTKKLGVEKVDLKNAADLAKRGAAISASNMLKIQAIHDHTADMGAKCNKEAAEGAGDLQKVAGERDEALVKLAALTTEAEKLKKAASERDEEIKKLKAEPLPAKGVTKTVTKTDDNIADPTKDQEKVIKIDPTNPQSVQDGALAMIKAAHTNPMRIDVRKALVSPEDLKIEGAQQ